MTEKKTSVDDIIGIVKTEEATDSVEEVRKLRGRETMTGKRFEEVYGEMGLFRVKDNKTGKYYKAVLCGNPFTETDEPILDVLNEIADENVQLKEQIADLETSFDICKHYKEAYGTEIVKIKQTIKDMLENERTELGRSVLRQLWEAIQ